MASGGSVIAIKYNGGALMASDTLLSYGSLAKLPNVQRAKILGKYTAVCATGDFADFQAMTRELEQEILSDTLYNDGVEMAPSEIFSILHRKMYAHRTDFQPCLCRFVVVGRRSGESFLGVVDDIGTRWTDNCVATGFGQHLAIPLLRRAVELRGDELTREEAMAVLTDCLKVLFYRECRTINRFQFVDATDDRVTISDPVTLDTQWEFQGFAFEKTAVIR